mgnify:CR=1 FL=1
MRLADHNASMLEGTELADDVVQGIITATTTAAPVQTISRRILWILFQNLGTANVFFGASNVANSGANRGPRMTPNGETPVLPVNDLNKIWLISASGSQDVAYIAGIR